MQNNNKMILCCKTHINYIFISLKEEEDAQWHDTAAAAALFSAIFLSVSLVSLV